MIVPVDSPDSITAALDLAVTMPATNGSDMAERARAHALQFDRMQVFDRLLERVVQPSPAEVSGHAAGSAPLRACLAEHGRQLDSWPAAK